MKYFVNLSLFLLFCPNNLSANEFTCNTKLLDAQIWVLVSQNTLNKCVDQRCNGDATCGGKSDRELCPEESQYLDVAKEELSYIQNLCGKN